MDKEIVLDWLDNRLKNKIKNIFEARYKRVLSDPEIMEIAINLTDVIEEIVKFKWKEKYKYGI